MLAVARTGDRDQLAAAIKDMEIPDFAKWFNKTYGKPKGRDSAELYRMNVDYDEYKFADSLIQMTEHDGQVVTRKVNDGPQPGNQFEASMLRAMRKPVDTYFASWRAADAPASQRDGIDGKFRWNNAIHVVTVQRLDISDAPAANPPANSTATPDETNKDGPFRPGKNGVGYPSCSYCPNPPYTKEAEAAHIRGAVVFQAVIQPGGYATDIKLVKGLGFGLDEIALASLKSWRFKPATGPGGQPVPTIIPIAVSFYSQ
jgi:TonB family protein